MSKIKSTIIISCLAFCLAEFCLGDDLEQRIADLEETNIEIITELQARNDDTGEDDSQTLLIVMIFVILILISAFIIFFIWFKRRKDQELDLEAGKKSLKDQPQPKYV